MRAVTTVTTRFASDTADPMLAAAERAYAVFAASLAGELWHDDAGRIAHARTLIMLGRDAEAHAVLDAGGPGCAIERMHRLHAADDWEGAIAVGRAAAERFPAEAVGFRNSTASMLSGLGRHAEALALIDANAAAEPDNAAWPELRALLLERMHDDGDAAADDADEDAASEDVA